MSPRYEIAVAIRSERLEIVGGSVDLSEFRGWRPAADTEVHEIVKMSDDLLPCLAERGGGVIEFEEQEAEQARHIYLAIRRTKWHDAAKQ